MVSRREFISKTALLGAAAVAVPSLLVSCKGEELPEIQYLDKAPDGRPLKAGLVGCGARGCGAALNFEAAGDGLKVTALADLFEDKLAAGRERLAKGGIIVDDSNCFCGIDAYKRLIDSDVDVVLLCTPPVFRPEHFEYAVAKGKHCFIEKPVAVDAVGARKMIAVGRQAEAKGLCVVSGLVYRYTKATLETYRRVKAGAIGDTVSACITRFNSSPSYTTRKPGWSDMEYMLRNWYNFTWANGDFIVGMAMHEVDLMRWFFGEKTPVRAEGQGGKARRVTGNEYDHFSVTYVFEDGHRASFMTRQIFGCDNERQVMVYGTKGYTDCSGTIYNNDGSIAWQYEKDKNEISGYVRQHIAFVKAIREGKPINDVEMTVKSNLVAIMGRESAYTGKFVTYDEMLASQMNLTPDSYGFRDVDWFSESAPVLGKDKV